MTLRARPPKHKHVYRLHKIVDGLQSNLAHKPCILDWQLCSSYPYGRAKLVYLLVKTCLQRRRRKQSRICKRKNCREAIGLIFRLFIEVNPPKSTLVYLACVFSDLMIICIKPAIILHADCQSYVLCTYREKRGLTYILHSTESSWLQKGQRNLVAKNTFFW